jgi:glycosyltransferase involved in cell wall biosynthesis
MYPNRDNPRFGAFMEPHVRALQRAGAEVVVVAPKSGQARRQLLARYFGLVLRTAFAAVRRFDVVHVHYPVITGWLGSVVAAAHRAPLVATVHGGELDDVQLGELSVVRRRLTRWLAGWTLRRADAVVAVSQRLAELARALVGSSARVVVADMGVDCSVFRPRPKSEARKALGVGSNAGIVLFVGWLIPLKAPDLFISAAALLQGNLPDVQWVLVGSGPMERALRDQAAGLGLHSCVHLVGRCGEEEVALWDAAADVLVMPSLAEQFGLVGLEACACGTPVVASDVGGVRSYLENEANGVLVPAGDAHALASAVDRLMKDPELRRSMGEKGVEVAKAHDVGRQAERVMEVYRGLVG